MLVSEIVIPKGDRPSGEHVRGVLHFYTGPLVLGGQYIM